jgi:hypothetical protein
MKYVLSFFAGVLFTSIFFIYYLKNRLVTTETSAATTEQEVIQNEVASGGLPTGFRKFYENFHRDSVFQLNHIRFPLEGLPEIEEETAEIDLSTFYWKKNEWTLHRPFDAMNGSFNRDFQPLGEDMVVETIRHTEANYAMQRRFYRDGNDWYLIYYAAMNKLVDEPQ